MPHVTYVIQSSDSTDCYQTTRWCQKSGTQMRCVTRMYVPLFSVPHCKLPGNRVR